MKLQLVQQNGTERWSTTNGADGIDTKHSVYVPLGYLPTQANVLEFRWVFPNYYEEVYDSFLARVSDIVIDTQPADGYWPDLDDYSGWHLTRYKGDRMNISTTDGCLRWTMEVPALVGVEKGFKGAYIWAGGQITGLSFDWGGKMALRHEAETCGC